MFFQHEIIESMNKFYAAFCRYQLQRYNFELQKHEKPEETELLQWYFAAVLHEELKSISHSKSSQHSSRFDQCEAENY